MEAGGRKARRVFETEVTVFSAHGDLLRAGRPCRIFALVVILHSPTGCFSAFMLPPPKTVEEPTSPVECTSSPVAPVLDGVCAVSLGVLTVGLAGAAATADPCEGGMTPCIPPGAWVTGAVIAGGSAVLCGLSAVSGAKKASRCAEMRRVSAACIEGDETACQRLQSGRLDP